MIGLQSTGWEKQLENRRPDSAQWPSHPTIRFPAKRWAS